MRTSTEDRTMQVAGAILAVMDPLVAGLPWPVYCTSKPPPCVHVRVVNPVGLPDSHTSPPRLTLSSQHIRAPPQPPCAKLSKPHERTTSMRTFLSRRASTLFLAQLNSTPGPIGVWFLSNPLLRCQSNLLPRFSSHRMIRRPLFRRVDRTYLSWPSAPL